MRWKAIPPVAVLAYGTLTASASGSPDIIWLRGIGGGGAANLSIAPNGQYLATSDSYLRLFRRSDSTLSMISRTPVGGFQTAMSRDGQYLVALTEEVSGDWFPVLYSVPSMSRLRTFPKVNYIRSMKFSADGSKVVIGDNGTTRVVNVSTGQLLSSFGSGVNCVDFSSDGARVLASDSQSVTRIWDWQAKTVLVTVPDGGYAAAFLIGGQQFATASHGFLRVWRTSDGELQQLIPYVGSGSVRLSVSPAGQHLAVALDNNVSVYSTVNWELESQFVVSGNVVMPIFLNEDRLVLGGTSGGVSVGEYDWRIGTLVSTVESFQESYREVAVSPAGDKILLPRSDTIVVSGTDGSLIHRFNSPYGAAVGGQFSPDGTKLAVSYLEQVAVYDTASWTELRLISENRVTYSWPSWSKDSQYLYLPAKYSFLNGQITIDRATVYCFDSTNWTSTFYRGEDYSGSYTKALIPDSGNIAVVRAVGGPMATTFFDGPALSKQYELNLAAKSISPDGASISTYGTDQYRTTLTLRSADSGDAYRTYTLPRSSPLIMSPDWTYFVLTNIGNNVNDVRTMDFYRVSDGSLQAQYDKNVDEPLAYDFDGDRSRIAFVGDNGTVGYLRNPVPRLVIATPLAFSVLLGQRLAGNLESLARLDGDSLVVAKFIMPNYKGKFVDVVLDGKSPFSVVTSLKLTTTAKMDVSGVFNQTLRLWNWNTSAWDVVDVRTDPLTPTYTPYALTASGNLARYVRAGDKAIRAKYEVSRDGPAASFTWASQHDQVVWEIGG